MKVLITDDHSLFIEGLKSLMTANGVEVAGVAMNANEATLSALAESAEILLIDVPKPGNDGLDTISHTKAMFPGIKIVVITSFLDIEFAREALHRGASGYLLKNTSVEEFMDLLTCVQCGEIALTRAMTTEVMRELAKLSLEGRRYADYIAQDQSTIDCLTPRQTAIYDRLSKGHTYREISNDLGIRPRTVGYHVHAILQKLHLRNRAQIIALAQHV